MKDKEDKDELILTNLLTHVLNFPLEFDLIKGDPIVNREEFKDFSFDPKQVYHKILFYLSKYESQKQITLLSKLSDIFEQLSDKNYFSCESTKWEMTIFNNYLSTESNIGKFIKLNDLIEIQLNNLNPEVIINDENNSILSKQNKKTGDKITNKQIPSSSLDTQIEKFVWLKSQDALECLFEELSEEKYIKDYSKQNLYQHFTIKSELKPLNETKDKLEYKKINWNSKNTNLVVLIFQLRLDGSIYFTGDRYHKMAFDHFDKDGNDLNMDSLKSAKSQITNKRTGYIDKPIFQELRNLIKRNKQP